MKEKLSDKNDEGIKEAKEREIINYPQEGLFDLEITEPIIVEGGDAFSNAKKIKVNKVEAGRDAFWSAKNCQVDEIKAKNAFQIAKNCQVNKVEAGRDAFQIAKNCQVNKVEAGRDAFQMAINCQVNKVIAKEDAFRGAENCLCATVKAKEIGIGSLGVVILGRAEGKVSPSVILMEGKLKKERPEEIKSFFEQELKKSQRGEESIFDYLSYFSWEGETIEEGRKKLKERYNTIKDKEELKEGLRKHYFYHLIDNNSRREEIFSGFEKLRKVEKKTLQYLDNYIPQLEELKEYLSVLSLKDWLKLGEYAEFLDYKKENFQEIEAKFDKITLDEILEKPEKFDNFKTAKIIKNFQNQGREINKEKIKKELQKEIEKKKNNLIREELLNSPEENLKTYLKEWGIKKEKVNEDILFASRLHKVLTEKGEYKNKEILEQLIKGKRPLDWEENKNWLEKMKEKFNTEAWLKPYSKEYSPLISKDYAGSLKTSQEEQKREIRTHLKEIGIELPPEWSSQKIESILLENRKKIPPNIQKDIKTHLQAIKSFESIEESELPKKIILMTEQNPLKAIQGGQKVIGSCLRIRGGSEQSNIPNSVDINKKVIWAKNEKEEILARVLIGITKEGKLAGFRIFNNDPRLEFTSLFQDFLSSLAKELKTELTSKGEIKELVGEYWHNDGIIEWEKEKP